MPIRFLRKLYQTANDIGFRDLLYLLGGSSSSQLFNAISVSLIYAFHTDSNAADYFLYLSFVSVFVNVASLRLEQAALVDKINSQYLLVYALIISLLTVLMFSSILMWLADISTYKLVEIMLLCLFWSAFLVLSIWAISNNKLKLLSASRVLQSLIFLMLIGVSVVFEEGEFLLSMMALSYLASILALVSGVKLLTKSPGKYHFCEMLKKHKAYMLFDLPSGLISSIAVYIPLWIVAAYYDETLIALFGFAIRVVYAPLNLLGGVIKDKYKADSVGLNAEMFHEMHFRYKSLLYRISIVLFILATILISMFVDNLVLFMSLIAVSIFRFNVSPVSFSIYFMGRIEWDLRLHVLLVLMLSCLAGVSSFLEFNAFILCYSMVMIVFYAIYDRFIVYTIKRY